MISFNIFSGEALVEEKTPQTSGVFELSLLEMSSARSY